MNLTALTKSVPYYGREIAMLLKDVSSKGFEMQIYEYLKQDHAELKELLKELVALNEQDDYRFVLIEEFSNLFVAHIRAEESVFYNTLRAVNADGVVVMQGYKEHLEAEGLLRALQLMDRFNLEWKGVAKKLKKEVERHIQEEETEIFSEARNVFTDEEATSIGVAFDSLKPQIRREGFIRTSFDFVVNMLPPRLADRMKNLDFSSRFHP